MRRKYAAHSRGRGAHSLSHRWRSRRVSRPADRAWGDEPRALAVGEHALGPAHAVGALPRHHDGPAQRRWIGGPYIMGLIRHAPARIASAVMMQPIGLDGNRDAFHAPFATPCLVATFCSMHPGKRSRAAPARCSFCAVMIATTRPASLTQSRHWHRRSGLFGTGGHLARPQKQGASLRAFSSRTPHRSRHHLAEGDGGRHCGRT